MTSPGSDPYAELGVPTGADRRTVRRAYLAKARAHHPDHGGNDRAMARINEAFELLNDPVRLAAYQASRARAAENSKVPPWTGSAGPPPGRPSGSVLDFGIYHGWSLGEIARYDPGYLAWLEERREGTPYLAEIERLLARMRQEADASGTGRRGRR